MNKGLILPGSPVTRADLRFVRTTLRSALAVLEHGAPAPGVQIRFTRDTSPFHAGDETELPAYAAFDAVKRGEAELVEQPRKRGRK